MKVETKVYLPPDLAKELDKTAARMRRPKSEIVRAAVASFLSPDGAERTEAALLRRLDRMNRHIERVEREAQVSNEALAIFIRTWLGTTPIVSSGDQAAVQALGRRLSSGASLADQAFESNGGQFDEDGAPKA